MKVKELKGLLNLFNEDTEVSIEAGLCNFGFEINDIRLSHEECFDKSLNRNVQVPVVHLISYEVQDMDSDRMGEDL